MCARARLPSRQGHDSLQASNKSSSRLPQSTLFDPSPAHLHRLQAKPPHPHTWQPTPINSSRLTVPASASTVARTSRFGLRVGFTPRAARMSPGVRATTGLGPNLWVLVVVDVWEESVCESVCELGQFQQQQSSMQAGESMCTLLRLLLIVHQTSTHDIRSHLPTCLTL